MKLLRMHVDNFGRLHDYDFSFEDGMNIILEENGWGKTTMAAFLKAMLYGFDSGLSRDITENERKRYYPWQGGVYGGTLEFESEGVRYSVKRTFGENQRSDSVKIINMDTGEPVRIAAGSLGEELFKLDAGAFQRIVFINQNLTESAGGSESIQNRLNSLIARANNTAAYEAAVAGLSQQERVYETNDGRGRIDSLNREITEKQNQCDLLEREAREQEAARARLRDIAGELDEVRRRIEKDRRDYDRAVEHRRKLEAARSELEEVNGEIAVLQEKQDVMREELGGTVPEDAVIDQNRQRIRRAEELSARIADLESTRSADSAAYQEISDRYQGEIPDTGILDRIYQMSGELQGLRRAYADEEAAAQQETVPEGYKEVKAAADADHLYPETLKGIISAESAVRDMIRMKDTNAQALAHEEESWKNTQTRFAALNREIDERQAELDRLQEYNPEATAPVIAELNELSSRKQDLEHQKNMLEAMLKKEADEWEALKTKYRGLTEETAAIQKVLDDNADNHPDKIKPYLQKLGEMQRLEQAISLKQEALDRNRITEEEKGLLEANKDPLPEPGEAEKMKTVYRRIMREQAEKDSYTKKIDAEKVKADDLNTELLKLDEIKDDDLTPVAEPAKGSGTLLIVLGVIALIAGGVMAVILFPAMAVIAAAGLAMIIFGLIGRSKYRKAYGEYEAYRKELERRASEREQKKTELKGRIDTVQEGIKALNGNLEESSNRMKDDERDLIQWVQKYGRAEKRITEEVISRIGINADRLRVLRARAKEQKDARDFIRKQTDYINQILAHTAGVYKDTADLGVEAASESLRKKEMEYRVQEEKLAAAKEAEKKFLEENKCTAEQLADEKPFKASEAREKLVALDGEFTSVDEARWALDAKYGAISGMSFEEAADFLRGKSEEYKVADGQLQAARRNEVHYLLEAGVTRESIAQPDSEKTVSLRKAKDELDEKFDHIIREIRNALSPVHIETTGGNVTDAIRTAARYSSEYSQYSRILQDRAQRQTKRAKDAQELETWLSDLISLLKGNYAEEPLNERLDHVRADIGETESLHAKITQLGSEIDTADTERKQTEAEMREFEHTYGAFAVEGEDIFAAICRKKEDFKDSLNEMAPLLKQREAITEELDGMTDDGGERENSLHRSILMLEARRDALVSESSRKKEFIRQAERSAENLPDMKREISLLYEERENARNELDLLKRAVRTISEAKENLAGRYIGKVEQLFNDYMQIWLGNDAVRGILDADFNVSIEENNKVHVAEGYSTGYCDLMDFCMRLALIDTLFENEQPFLILDDPFINLDEERLGKALELLSAMSATRQIVYFVCHPVRALKSTGTAADRERFRSIAEKARQVLDERMAALPVHRTRTDENRNDLWHVSDGPLPFAVSGQDDALAGDIVTLSFRVAGGGIHPDRMYDLFFVDETGRVISGRRLLELRNERLTPAELTFCLSPQADSGTAYRLMVRESGNGDYDIDAALPFAAPAAA